jgi:tRNA(Ile)-lysidine synthase
LLAPLADVSQCLLAVSGGPDSLAMMVVTAHWAQEKRKGPRPVLSVATVDHGLRKEAADEARFVAKIAKSLGLKHKTLRWEGSKPRTGVQAAARDARYQLLCDHAATIGARALVLAHHADDQAETLLMRLCAGSGPAGLSGMSAVSLRDDLFVLRPFLDVPGARLKACLSGTGFSAIEDPSNSDARFTRVRFRGLRDSLESEGLDAARLGRLAKRMQRIEAALAVAVAEAERMAMIPQASGLRFAALLWTYPDEIILRVIGRAIARVGGRGAPDLAALEDVCLALSDTARDGKRLKRTLGGTVLTCDSAGVLKLVSENDPRQHKKA